MLNLLKNMISNINQVKKKCYNLSLSPQGKFVTLIDLYGYPGNIVTRLKYLTAYPSVIICKNKKMKKPFSDISSSTIS